MRRTGLGNEGKLERAPTLKRGSVGGKVKENVSLLTREGEKRRTSLEAERRTEAPIAQGCGSKNERCGQDESDTRSGKGGVGEWRRTLDWQQPEVQMQATAGARASKEQTRLQAGT